MNEFEKVKSNFSANHKSSRRKHVQKKAEIQLHRLQAKWLQTKYTSSPQSLPERCSHHAAWTQMTRIEIPPTPLCFKAIPVRFLVPWEVLIFKGGPRKYSAFWPGTAKNKANCLIFSIH